MPYCPECKFEYRPDINKCPDCDVWLVASLDANRNERPASMSDSFDRSRSNPPPQYSDELKQLMKSLPKGPAIPTGPLSPGSTQATDNYDPNSDDPIAKKLNEYDTWIEIAHLPFEQISRLLSDGLESLGIPCVVMPGSRAGKTFGEMFGGGQAAPDNDILLVPEEFVERADIEAAELLGEAYEGFKTGHN